MPRRAAAEPDPRLRLVYEESLRALADQRDGLDALRGRAAQLLTAASLVQTFLVGLVLGRDGRPTGATWVGAAAFVLLSLVCVAVLLPRRGWTTANSATVLLDGYVDAEPPATIDGMHRALAIHMEANWDRNQLTLNRTLFALQCAAALLAVCILASALDLRGRESHAVVQRAQARAPAVRAGERAAGAEPRQARVAAGSAAAGAQAPAGPDAALTAAPPSYLAAPRSAAVSARGAGTTGTALARGPPAAGTGSVVTGPRTRYAGRRPSPAVADRSRKPATGHVTGRR